MAARQKGSRESYSQRHRQAQAADGPPPAGGYKATPAAAAAVDPPSSEPPTAKSRISVCLRKRPINSAEESRGERDIVSVHESERLVVVHEPKVKVDMTKYIEDHEFRFDAVFSETARNADVYAITAKPLVATMFAGGKATCFAYGQTGSGKTHTMSGNGDGLYLLAAEDIFAKLADSRTAGGSTIHVSYFEIYGGELFDLLAERGKLVAREDAAHKVQIVGLQEHHVESVEQFFQLMEYGNAIRSTGATGVNADSSRSHAVLQIVLRRAKKEHGKLSFIDLAGSERAADTSNNDRRRRIEGAEINKSLLALKECIRALDQDKGHTPFRQSKLTQVLKDSFVCPDSRTVMIATLSPTNFAAENTLNTLRYADRVKELRSKGSGGPAAGPGSDENRPGNRPVPGGAAAGAAAGAGRPYPAREPPRGAADPAAAARRAPAPAPAPAPGRGGGASDDPNPSAVEALVETHAELVSVILQEKEDLILAHRQQIDDMMELVKSEMRLLHAVDQPGSAVDDYVTALAELLAQKTAVVKRLQARLGGFQLQLQQEEALSKSLEHSLPMRR